MAQLNQAFRHLNGEIKRVHSELPAELGQNSVLLKITHSSLCHTDILLAPYGLALGHEGVGIVEKVGSSVTSFKIGDRAGAGYHRSSCGKCKYCLTGQDIWCNDRLIYGEGDINNGTFSTYFVADETYLHHIPDAIPSELAAPLQCAGATTYGALRDVVKPGDRVGVVGIGGLGHLAIQYAAKLGAEVVVFSSSSTKETEARSFGATEFILLNEPERITRPVDVLVLSGAKYPEWSRFLQKTVLARRATLVPLTAPQGDFTMPSVPLFFEGYRIHTSLVASRQVHNEMLEFSALHKIKPVVQLFDFSEEGFKAAVEKVESQKIKYRAVLVV